MPGLHIEHVMLKYLRNKARSTIRHTFTKEKEIPEQQGRGAGTAGSTPKSALVFGNKDVFHVFIKMDPLSVISSMKR